MTLALKDACGQCVSGLTTTMNFEKGDAIADDGDPTVTGCSAVCTTLTLYETEYGCISPEPKRFPASSSGTSHKQEWMVQ